MDDRETRDRVLFSGPRESLPLVRERLGDRFDVRWVPAEPGPLLAELEGSRAYLDASMKVRIPSEAIEKASALELVVTATTGADHIDRAALERRGIPLLTLKGEKDLLWNITAAAELGWALVLACARQLPAAVDHVLEGGWDRVRFPGMMLNGRRMGIVGMGRIGSWTAGYARAFGMEVAFHDPYATEVPEGTRRLPLDELLAASDVVSVHVHLNDETRGLISADRIARLAEHAILVNTSRGEVVDEAAVAEAIRSGRLAAYGADVLAGEPDVDQHPLVELARTHANVVLTPHIGGFSPDALARVIGFSCDRIRSHLGG